MRHNKFGVILLDSFYQKKYLSCTSGTLLSGIRHNIAVATTVYAGGPGFEPWLEGQLS